MLLTLPAVDFLQTLGLVFLRRLRSSTAVTAPWNPTRPNWKEFGTTRGAENNSKLSIKNNSKRWFEKDHSFQYSDVHWLNYWCIVAGRSNNETQ